uniref:Peptidase M16 C-terminal domain-containing protein n=1 Tax=Clastoptera arizonana TaxID=38151 RepID=A0A1B6DGR0_9HEMI
MSNASTSLEDTNYYFDVVPEHLSGALDRFAQFFLCPLFTESATEREVNAVNSEHEKNLSNDSWRIDQLEKSTAKSDHDFNRFGTGNKLTLDSLPKEKGINVRDELLKFHNTWYSSNIMTLSVLGKESLDELEEMTVNLFSEVKNKQVKVSEWLDSPYGPEQLQIKGFIIPIKDMRNLSICFPVPDLHKYYKAGPGSIISHLIGHEGPGSLLSTLRNKGWCNSLVGGHRPAAKGFGFFTVNVDLTEEGIEHVDDIVKLIFQYINMLKKEGPQKWIFEEYREILKMHFRFKDNEVPRYYVSNLVHSMREFPMDEVLSGGYVLEEWQPDLINYVLSYLNPDNVRVAVVGKQFENITDQAELWYGTKYKAEKIPQETIQNWKDGSLYEDLHLPSKNEFIPSNFDLLPPEENPNPFPDIIKETSLTRVWFKQDDVYHLPKTYHTFEFVSPLAYLDPTSCNKTYMFTALFKDALNEYAYSAQLAGIKWELTNTKYGLVLAFGGYNDKQHILLEKIMDRMTNFKIDPKRFEIIKEAYIRSLKNFETEQPYQHGMFYLAVLLSETAWTKEELLDATNDLSVEKVQDFIPQILSKMYIECLIHGNTDKKSALNIVHSVEEKLKSSVSL